MYIKVPVIEDPRGNLSFIENSPNSVYSYEPKQAIWYYDIPGGYDLNLGSSISPRLVLALSGAITVDEHRLSRSFLAKEIESDSETVLSEVTTNTLVLLLDGLDTGAVLPPLTHTEEPNDDLLNVFNYPTASGIRIFELRRHKMGAASFSRVSNIEDADWLPFQFKRIYYIYDVPTGAVRGSHSHIKSQCLMVALSGSFDVLLDDGKNPVQRITLNRPYQMLHIPERLWRTMENFSGGAICMVLSSELYDADDYIRDYDEFLQHSSSVPTNL